MNESTEMTTGALSPVTPIAPNSAVQLGTLTASSPAALIKGATEMATALADVIRSRGLAVQLQGREYVRVEGWTTLATMLGVTAREVTTTECDGIFTAVVELVRMVDGAVISRASAECGSDDEKDRYGRPVGESPAVCPSIDGADARNRQGLSARVLVDHEAGRV